MELAELDQHTTKGDVAKTKAFMSRMTDRFRPPYGKHSIPQPRQCGFGCTTNSREYLPDETGNRRWWPLVCTGVDLDQLDLDRDQLFGEAVALYQAGEAWWLETRELTKLAAVEQDQRYVTDAWDDLIRNHLDNFPPIRSTSIAEILADVIKLEVGKWGQKEQNRVAKCLRVAKWERRQIEVPRQTKKASRKRPWRYFRPKEEQE
jgi:putative DNA primase/helicase